MHQLCHPGLLSRLARRLAASALLPLTALAPPALADPSTPASGEVELIELNNSWPTLQTLLDLPDWMELQGSFTAEPLFNPIGGLRSAGSWIQQTSLDLTLGSGLNQPTERWDEFDHWRLNLNVNHDAGDAYYNQQIGALFSLQTAANPVGLYFSEASVERKRGDGWLGVKAGILPLDPEFVAAPVLNFYVHASLNDTLNLYTPNLPIDPFAALGGVLSIHPSDSVTVRYGLFDLSTTQGIGKWLTDFPDGVPDGSGSAQFLQLTLEPDGWGAATATPIAACRTPQGISRRGGTCSQPVQVQNQLPAGSINLGGFITSENGDGVYGTVTWRSGLPLGLDDRLWVGGSYTPDSAQVIATSFIAGGVVIQGPLPGRPLDVALLGIGRGGLSNQLSTSPYEGMLELGYKIQLNESLNLQPTLQWIFNPSGASEPVPGILAAGMQIELNF